MLWSDQLGSREYAGKLFHCQWSTQNSCPLLVHLLQQPLFMTPSPSLPHWSQLFWDMFFCYQWLNSQSIIITAEAWFFCQKTYISLKTGFHCWCSKLIYVHTNFTVSVFKLFIYGVFESILVSMKLFILCKSFSLPLSCCCAFQMWFPWSLSAASCHHPLMFLVWDPFKHMEVTSNGSHILLHSQVEFCPG